MLAGKVEEGGNSVSGEEIAHVRIVLGKTTMESGDLVFFARKR